MLGAHPHSCTIPSEIVQLIAEIGSGLIWVNSSWNVKKLVTTKGGLALEYNHTHPKEFYQLRGSCGTEGSSLLTWYVRQGSMERRLTPQICLLELVMEWHSRQTVLQSDVSPRFRCLFCSSSVMETTLHIWIKMKYSSRWFRLCGIWHPVKAPDKVPVPLKRAGGKQN